MGQPNRISDQLAPRIQKLIERLALQEGDRVSWELTVQVGQPAPNQPPGVYAVLIMVMPSPVLGQHHVSGTQFVALNVSDEALEGFVRQGVEALRSARSDALRASPVGA